MEILAELGDQTIHASWNLWLGKNSLNRLKYCRSLARSSESKFSLVSFVGTNQKVTIQGEGKFTRFESQVTATCYESL